MSIATIVTAGFGSFGSISFVTTRGYSPFVPPAVYGSRANMNVSVTLTVGENTQEYSLEPNTMTAIGTLDAGNFNTFVRQRARPLRSRAFHKKG